jgi:DNA polymerase III delta subunit
MIIFLYGPDDYRRIGKKRELIAEFKKKRSDLGVAYFDFEKKEGIEDFLGFTRSSSLFETAKLAVIDHAFEIEAKPLAALLQPFTEDKSISILMSEREKPVKAINFLLEKPTISQKFENLEGADWLSFIAGEAKKLGVKLAPAAANFLASVHQGNSWALATELQKLSGLSGHVGEVGATIEKKLLDEFNLEAAPNYWMLLNGLKSYDVRTRLSTLEKLLAMNDPAAKIFNIMSAQAGEKIPRFAEFDFAIKSGKLDYEEALVALAIS